MKEIYELQLLDGPWQEVSQEDYIRAERSAGFQPKPGCGPVATGSFGCGAVRGHVRYIEDATT